MTWSAVIVPVTEYYWCYEMKDSMGDTCSTHGVEQKCIYNLRNDSLKTKQPGARRSSEGAGR
jgi:hypothetical protein